MEGKIILCTKDGSYVCFKHAVMKAMNGEDIELKHIPDTCDKNTGTCWTCFNEDTTGELNKRIKKDLTGNVESGFTLGKGIPDNSKCFNCQGKLKLNSCRVKWKDGEVRDICMKCYGKHKHEIVNKDQEKKSKDKETLEYIKAMCEKNNEKKKA